MSRFDELRARHPRFTYEDYSIERVGADLKLTFSFTMAPDLAFAPTTTLRAVDGTTGESDGKVDGFDPHVTAEILGDLRKLVA